MKKRLVAETRREQLLLVARSLFARLGYEATSTALIASEAGVSERLLYKHVASKKELFLTVVAGVAEGVATGYRALAAANLSVLAGLSSLYALRFTDQDAPGRTQPLFFGRSYGPFEDPTMDQALGEAYRLMADAGTAYFASLAQRGLLRESLDPLAAAWMLAALFREHESMRLAYSSEEVADLDRRLLQQFVAAVAR